MLIEWPIDTHTHTYTHTNIDLGKYRKSGKFLWCKTQWFHPQMPQNLRKIQEIWQWQFGIPLEILRKKRRERKKREKKARGRDDEREWESRTPSMSFKSVALASKPVQVVSHSVIITEKIVRELTFVIGTDLLPTYMFVKSIRYDLRGWW